MTKVALVGVVSAEEWQRIGDEDALRRANIQEHDVPGSLLTAVSGILILAMLAIGPVWTAIAVIGGADEHSAEFEKYWFLPLVLTVVAAVPLALALRRERSRARWVLAGLLGVSLAIQLATCPWL